MRPTFMRGATTTPHHAGDALALHLFYQLRQSPVVLFCVTQDLPPKQWRQLRRTFQQLHWTVTRYKRKPLREQLIPQGLHCLQAFQGASLLLTGKTLTAEHLRKLQHYESKFYCVGLALQGQLYSGAQLYQLRRTLLTYTEGTSFPELHTQGNWGSQLATLLLQQRQQQLMAILRALGTSDSSKE